MLSIISSKVAFRTLHLLGLCCHSIISNVWLQVKMVKWSSAQTLVASMDVGFTWRVLQNKMKEMSTQREIGSAMRTVRLNEAPFFVFARPSRVNQCWNAPMTNVPEDKTFILVVWVCPLVNMKVMNKFCAICVNKIKIVKMWVMWNCHLLIVQRFQVHYILGSWWRLFFFQISHKNSGTVANFVAALIFMITSGFTVKRSCWKVSSY